MLTLALLTMLSGDSTEPQATAELEACASKAVAAPQDVTSWHCFAVQTRKHGNWGQVKARVSQLQEEDPSRIHAQFVLAGIALDQGRDEAEFLYRDAARGYAEAGDLAHEALSRVNLAVFLGTKGRYREQLEQLDLAAERAAQGEHAPVLTSTKIERARAAMNFWGDYATAEDLLLEAHALEFPRGIEALQIGVLRSLSSLYAYTGRLDEAIATNRTLIELLHGANNRYAEAGRLANDVKYRLQKLELRGETAEPSLQETVRDALRLAEESGNPWARAELMRYLGELRGPVGIGNLQTALQLAEELDSPAAVVEALVSLGLQTLETDPESAQKLVTEALRQAEQDHSPYTLVRALGLQARVHRRLGPPERARQSGLVHLDAIEAARALEREDEASARVFVSYADAYRLFSGGLYGEWLATHEADALTTAFAVTERMRARALLDMLDRSGVNAGARLDQPELTLEQVQANLSDEEAMLLFQIAPDAGPLGRNQGGSWRLLITANSIHVDRLSSGPIIETRARALVGLIASGQDFETPAKAFSNQLLSDSLKRLPTKVHRLIVIADRALHRVPFSALPQPNDQPLVARFELEFQPSAAVWFRLRGLQDPPGDRALVLADPQMEAHAGDDMEHLAALPHARREAEAVRSILGEGVETWIGAEANEQKLTPQTLRSVSLLHIATHAVVDPYTADRNAILLSPTDRSDGRLQIEEIAQRRLDASLVVLSACDSASGELIDGEGVFGLARAFLVAGASAVIGTLWRLPDHAAVEVFERFYGHLAAGASAVEALAWTQRELRDNGVSPRVWAALVLVGRGDVKPMRPAPAPEPGRLASVTPPGTTYKRLGALLLASGLLMLLGGLIRGRRHRTSR